MPVVKCEFHTFIYIVMFRKECQIPLCSKCSIRKKHHGHTFEVLEEIYAEKYALQQTEFSKIQKYFLPITEELTKNIDKDATEIKKVIPIDLLII